MGLPLDGRARLQVHEGRVKGPLLGARVSRQVALTCSGRESSRSCKDAERCVLRLGVLGCSCVLRIVD